MKVDEWTSEDVHTSGGGEFPPCAGLTSNALPEAQSTVSAESSQTGVSTRNAHIASKPKAQKEEDFGSVTILGDLTIHANNFATLNKKNFTSATPLKLALNFLILALNDSAFAFVSLSSKKLRILS